VHETTGSGLRSKPPVPRAGTATRWRLAGVIEELRREDDRLHMEGGSWTVDCGSLVWHLQNTRTIEMLGSAYYHPVLPLIPPRDREEQIARWLGLGQHLFWRDWFRGFWGRLSLGSARI
jgi:hypothetical protein